MPRRRLPSLALAFGALFAAAAPLQAVELERARVISDGRGYLFSFHFDGPTTHRHFTLRNHDRLVVDFKDAQKGGAIANLPVEGELVKGIRYGLRKGKELRIVIDLTAPATYAVGSLEGEPNVLRVTLTRADGERFDRRELPKVAPPPAAAEAGDETIVRLTPQRTTEPTADRAKPLAIPPATPPQAAQPPAQSSAQLPATPARDLKCLKLVDGHQNCEKLIDEVMAVTDKPYPHDAPPPPAATFEVERPEPKPEPRGSLGVHRFTKQTKTGKQRTDIGYKTYVGDGEIGVSILRPSLTWETTAGEGDLRMLLRPDEFQVGYQMQWK